MISASGIGGIKTLSNLGGLPALFIELVLLAGLVKIMVNPAKYDVNKKDYDSGGKVIPKQTRFIKGAIPSGGIDTLQNAQYRHREAESSGEVPLRTDEGGGL